MPSKIGPTAWDKARYDRDYYQRHHSRLRAKLTRWNRQRRAKNHDRLLTYLSAHPCVDCGMADVLVLEFDHVRGLKRTEVTTLARRGCSWASVLAEIAKCEVRCANCHRRVTVKRREAKRLSGADMQEKPKGWTPSLWVGRFVKVKPEEAKQKEIRWNED